MLWSLFVHEQEIVQQNEEFTKAQLWNMLLLLQRFSWITTNDCRWWNCSYLLAKHWVFHWWRQLSCTLVRYSRPVEGYSGTLHKCGSWVMYSLTCRTVHNKTVDRDRMWEIMKSDGVCNIWNPVIHTQHVGRLK